MSFCQIGPSLVTTAPRPDSTYGNHRDHDDGSSSLKADGIATVLIRANRDG